MSHKDEITSYLFEDNWDYIEDIYASYLQDPLSVDPSWIPFFQSLSHEAPQKKVFFSTEPRSISDKNTSIEDDYRAYGHFCAQLDPLNLTQPRNHPRVTQGSQKLQDLYCRSLGYEFMHIDQAAEKKWFIEKIEQQHLLISKDAQWDVFEILLRAELFEQYLHTKFQGSKRFSLEGGEVLVPALRHLLKKAKASHMQGAIIGMSHRGRLNVIANALDLPYSAVFKKFIHHPEGLENHASGDVKYHMGATAVPAYLDSTFELSLLFNPSHLESVNPVVLGAVRAKQEESENHFLGILIHGDASVIGQGVVAESLNLTNLKGYSTQGTIHIIVNNQIGFTANPDETRSSFYCSEIMKCINAPIIHVNGDDVEAVLWAIEIAQDYHSTFHKDIAIDLVCYRKYGHNETDEPAFTQPVMYQAISEQKSIAQKYGAELLISEQETLELKSRLQKQLQDEHVYAQTLQLEECPLHLQEQNVLTGIPREILVNILEKATSIPQDYKVNSKILRQLEQRREISTSGTSVDWAGGELLCFGSLLLEEKGVRLSGQDSVRGTFSHRHSIVTCQTTGRKYTPLNHLSQTSARFDVINSSLSEFAVMGFEFGYALHKRRNLIMWEAQFGDFANGAQTIIDQYICASEAKWGETNGLVLLLPHGYEGQGPEHSSAKLERYLQLCAQYNMQVIYPTTPANLFHALRRQVSRNYLKPLIVMTPKSLLRHKLAVSKLEDFETGTSFQKVISSEDNVSGKTEKLIFCTGKIYYHLIESGIKAQIVRLEQLYPFPEREIIDILKATAPEKVLWVQEEPENMGAWRFVDRKLERVLSQAYGHLIPVHYIGRREAASTATGYMDIHLKEQDEIIEKAGA